MQFSNGVTNRVASPKGAGTGGMDSTWCLDCLWTKNDHQPQLLVAAVHSCGTGPTFGSKHICGPLGIGQS